MADRDWAENPWTVLFADPIESMMSLDWRVGERDDSNQRKKNPMTMNGRRKWNKNKMMNKYNRRFAGREGS